MKKLFLHIIAVSAFWGANAQQQPIKDTAAMRLDEILDRVEQAYPSIKQYDERLKAIEQRMAVATAWMAPMFSVGASDFAYQKSMWKEQSPMNQAGIMFSLSQAIPNSGRLRAQRDYYASQAGIEQNYQQWTKNTLRTEAKLFYIQRLVAERKLSTLTESQELLKLIIKVAEDKYVYNQSEVSVIYKAKSKLGEVANMQEMQRSLIQSASIGLNTLMNREVGTTFRIDTLIHLHNYEQASLYLTDSALTYNRSDIRAMSSTIQSMRKDQTARAAMRRPDFEVGVSHGQMLGMPNTWSVMGGITIPIVPWTSRGWKSEIKMMDYEISAMQREQESMQLMATQMAAEKLNMLGYEKKQYQNYSMIIIPELQKNVETALLQYRQTTGNLFVLLDGWEMLLMKTMEQQDKLGQVMQLEAQYEYETEKR